MAKAKSREPGNFAWLLPLVGVIGILIGASAGYIKWGWPMNWYVGRDADQLPKSAENDLIREGWKILVDTPRHIGKSASDPAKRFSGNNLACTNCHLNAGLVPYAAP